MVRTRLNIGCRYSTPVLERPLHPTRSQFKPQPSQTQAPVTPATEPERRAGGGLTTHLPARPKASTGSPRAARRASTARHRPDARAHTAAATRCARPAAGRGGRPGGDRHPPFLAGRHTLQYIFSSIGVGKQEGETRSRCQASTPSPEASRAPRTSLRHLWWCLRALGGRPRTPSWGNCQSNGIRSTEGRQTPITQA